MTYLGMAVTFVLSGLIVNIVWAGVQYINLKYRAAKLNKLFKELEDLYRDSTRSALNDGWETIDVGKNNSKNGKLH